MGDIHEELLIKQEVDAGEDDLGETEEEEEEEEEEEDNDRDPDEQANEKEPADVSHYTLEEKIVAAVWVHERVRNHMTWHQMMVNFKYRFRNKPPSKQTLLCWERKLFTTGNAHDKTRSGRPIARLMHVPYVKQSIEESPNLSIRERAKELGLPYATLLKILKEDLKMAYVPDEDAPKKKSTLHSPNTSGKWKFMNNDSKTPSKKQKLNNVKNEKTNKDNLPMNVNNISTSNNTSPSSNSYNQPSNISATSQPSSSYNYGIHPNQMQSSTNQMVSLYQNYTNY